MLLTKSINIKMNRGNIGYYNNVMDKKFKVGDLVEIPIDKIPKSMYVKVDVKCDICYTENIVTYRNYNDCLKYGFYTCNSCKHIKRKMTNLEKWGFENFNNSEKRMETLYNNYGFYNNGRDKSKKTCELKYGVDNVSKIEEVKEKKSDIFLEKWGVSNPTFIKSNNFISSLSNYIKYDIDEKLHIFKCEKGHTFSIDTNLFYSRYYRGVDTCTICNEISDSKSSYEEVLFKFISDNYDGEIIRSYRDKYEIDIYLPYFEIGIEVNGLYYHSSKFKEKNYHLEKTTFFEKRGIRIIHIWEDDIIHKIDIIKSILINILKKSKRIFARKCEIKEINDKAIIKDFLDINHIQGYTNSSKKSIGLLYNNELVSLMCFDDLEGRKRIKDGGFNLNRFCNKLNTTVVGGASKLLKYFIDNYSPSYIISYSDYSFSNGNLYKNLGFNVLKKTYPDYKYIVANKRIHKSNFKKDKMGIKNEKISEREFTELKGIYRIWDCGKIKFIKNITQ